MLNNLGTVDAGSEVVIMYIQHIWLCTILLFKIFRILHLKGRNYNISILDEIQNTGSTMSAQCKCVKNAITIMIR